MSFIIPSYQSRYLDKLAEDETYQIDITPYRSKRSRDQNGFFWALLGEIEKHLSGRFMDEFSLYCQILEMANVKYEYVMCLPEAVLNVTHEFRAIHKVDEREYNGVQMVVLKCYIGSSKFTIKQMNELIEVAIDYARQSGIDVDRYER